MPKRIRPRMGKRSLRDLPIEDEDGFKLCSCQTKEGWSVFYSKNKSRRNESRGKRSISDAVKEKLRA